MYELLVWCFLDPKCVELDGRPKSTDPFEELGQFFQCGAGGLKMFSRNFHWILTNNFNIFAGVLSSVPKCGGNTCGMFYVNDYFYIFDNFYNFQRGHVVINLVNQ